MEERFVYLMCRNTQVMKYNVDTGEFIVLNDKLLPYPLKDRFREIPEVITTKYERNQALLISSKNNEAYNNWLMCRLLPIDRANAKRVVLALGKDPIPKLQLIYLYRGLSVTDNYWITTNTKTKWEDVNVRKVSLSESIALVALHGTSITLQGRPITPEVTTQGAYAKAWLRRDGALWLYKKGAKDATESRIEVMVSNILDKCNVRHVHYEMADEPDPSEVESPHCCRCQCITDDSHMIVPASDYMSYCNVHNLNFDKECVRIDKDLYYKMMIVDYLIANRDRHTMNWGFYSSGVDNHIICMHPLFDHNNAFDKDYMENPDFSYQALDNITMREAAKYAMQKVDFHFTEPIVREDFITQRHYDCFMSRAKELGITTDTSEMLNWCKEHAPKISEESSDASIVEYMHDSWIKYLRNDYGKVEL